MKSVWLTIGKVSILSFNPHTDLKCMDFGHLNYWNLLECILCQVNPHTSTDSVQSKSFRSRYLLSKDWEGRCKDQSQAGASTRGWCLLLCRNVAGDKDHLKFGGFACQGICYANTNLADLLVKEFVTLIPSKCPLNSNARTVTIELGNVFETLWTRTSRCFVAGHQRQSRPWCLCVAAGFAKQRQNFQQVQKIIAWCFSWCVRVWGYFQQPAPALSSTLWPMFYRTFPKMGYAS